jgi:condensin complex subunit 3
MRGKALVSLGLCCLIAKNMALSLFQLFVSQAHAELKVEVLKVIMDLLIMYDHEFFWKVRGDGRCPFSPSERFFLIQIW